MRLQLRLLWLLRLLPRLLLRWVRLLHLRLLRMLLRQPELQVLSVMLTLLLSEMWPQPVIAASTTGEPCRRLRARAACCCSSSSVAGWHGQAAKPALQQLRWLALHPRRRSLLWHELLLQRPLGLRGLLRYLLLLALELLLCGLLKLQLLKVLLLALLLLLRGLWSCGPWERLIPHRAVSRHTEPPHFGASAGCCCACLSARRQRRHRQPRRRLHPAARALRLHRLRLRP